MPTREKPAPHRGNRVHVRPPLSIDERTFLRRARESRALHRGFVQAPETPTAFAAYIKRYATREAEPRNVGLFVVRDGDGAIAGVINFSEIVRGAFRSAYVGYYALAPLAGDGYMTEGFALALDFAFRTLKLHRVEANVQPANRRSLALVARLGFVREGYSRRYVKIGGRWRDHIRFAILAEDWSRKRASLRRHPAADDRN